MVTLFFGRKNDTGEVVSVFDAEDGLSCNCSCLICQKPLVAHKGTSKGWHFSHASGVCRGSENFNLVKLCQLALTEENGINKAIYLPRLAYTIDDSEKEVEGLDLFVPVDAPIEYLVDDKFNPSVVIRNNKGEKVYLEFYTKKTDRVCSQSKIKMYREMNCKALEIKIDEGVLTGHTSLSSLLESLYNMFLNRDYSYNWISHPSLNKIIDLIEDKGIRYSNVSGLYKVYCPKSDSVVNVKDDCKKCRFKVSLSHTELKCRGNLTREQLIKLNPDAVFPPEEINYVGHCSNCGSDDTWYREDDGSLYRLCGSCNYAEEVSCPICGGSLRLKTNKDERFDSYKSQFIGCSDCNFTLTFKEPSGSYADEVKYTGGIDKIREDSDRYTVDLLRYRRARRR